MIDKLQSIRTISNRLAITLSVLVAVVVGGAFFAYQGGSGLVANAPLASFLVGVVGGFVGLQRRLKGLSDEDLDLLANSWVCVCLSPLVGGILAVVLYVLFISGLLSGDLFPRFLPDAAGVPSATVPGFSAIFEMHGGAADYAKMTFWSFVAGFSERFVTDIVSKFESKA